MRTARPGRLPGLAALLVGAQLALPVAAQNRPAPIPPMQPPPAEVLALIAEGEALAASGDSAAAEARLKQANDATILYDYADPLVEFAGNLALARFYRAEGNWTLTMRYGAHVAEGLDRPETREAPARVEALLYQAIGLAELGQPVAAEPILIRVFDATYNAGMTRLYPLAAYYLARVLTDLKDDNAADMRAWFLSLDAAGAGVTDAQVARLIFDDVVLRRAAGAPAKDLADLYGMFIGMLPGMKGLSVEDIEGYRSFYGILLSNAGHQDEALAMLEGVHRRLTEAGIANRTYLWNVQRLAMQHAVMKDAAGARDFLTAEVARARARGGDSDMIALLLRNLGEFSDDLGEPEAAQDWYRQAYAEYRKTRRATNADVLRLKALMRLDDPGMAGFAFAAELGVLGGVEFALRADAADALRLVLDGRADVLDAVLARLDAEGDETAALALNHAMREALNGDPGAARRALQRARDLAVLDPTGEVAPQAPIFELIDAVALLWGSGADWRLGEAVLALAGAKWPLMGEAERALYLALDLYDSFQKAAPPPLLRAGWLRWREEVGPDVAPVRGPLDALARLMVIEAAAQVADADAMQALVASLADLSADGRDGGMALAGPLARMLHLCSSAYGIRGATAVDELSGLEHRLTLGLPENHLMLVVARAGLAAALAARDDQRLALDWAGFATATLRQSKAPARDYLASLLARQALLYSELGETAVALTAAEEAYEALDFQQDRPDLILRVIETYATNAWAFDPGSGRTEAIFRRHAEDAAFLARLAPFDRATLLNDLAASIAWDRPAEAMALLELADDALASVAAMDTREMRSTLQWTRAIAAYNAGLRDVAFADMTASNDLQKAFDLDRLAAGAVDARANGNRARAAWEAQIGWDFAQTLPER